MVFARDMANLEKAAPCKPCRPRRNPHCRWRNDSLPRQLWLGWVDLDPKIFCMFLLKNDMFDHFLLKIFDLREGSTPRPIQYPLTNVALFSYMRHLEFINWYKLSEQEKPSNILQPRHKSVFLLFWGKTWPFTLLPTVCSTPKTWFAKVAWRDPGAGQDLHILPLPVLHL